LVSRLGKANHRNQPKPKDAATVQSELKFRVLLLAVGLIVFGAMATLYISGARDPNLRALYMQIMTFWGVEVTFKPYLPFVDLHNILASLECHRAGWDVFVENPCDALGRQFVYSPFWMVASPLGLTPRNNAWLGTALALVFFCTFAWMSNARSLSQSAIYIAALLSGVCAFAIERGNADVIMFLITVAACLALQYGTISRLFAYSALIVASLLKFYPIAALGLALYEKNRILATVVVATFVSWIIFLYIAWHQLGEELGQLLSQPISPYGDWFGGANIFHDLQIRLARHVPEQAATIAKVMYLLAVPVSIVVSIAMSSNLRAIGISPSSMNRELAMFLAAGLIIVFSFFAYQNLPYRGIFLLALLPFSMSSWRSAASGSIARSLWAAALGLIVALLWFQSLHYNVRINLGFLRMAKILVLAVREPLWWLFIVWLMAMLWIQLSSAPLAKMLLDRGWMYLNNSHPPGRPS
jgi:hypothetical protein